MTASTLTRSSVVQRLVDLVAAHDDLPADTTVSRGVPRDKTQTRRLIATGEITGDETSVPTMRRDRLTYRDQYRIEVLVIVWTDGDAEFTSSDDDCEQLAELVRDICAENPQLTVTGSDLCVTSAVVARADGPTGFHTDLGAASAMRLEVAIDARIT